MHPPGVPAPAARPPPLSPASEPLPCSAGWTPGVSCPLPLLLWFSPGPLTWGCLLGVCSPQGPLFSFCDSCCLSARCQRHGGTGLDSGTVLVPSGPTLACTTCGAASGPRRLSSLPTPGLKVRNLRLRHIQKGQQQWAFRLRLSLLSSILKEMVSVQRDSSLSICP